VISNAGNRQRNDAAVMLQEQLKKVGIRVTPRVSEFNSLITETGRRFRRRDCRHGHDTSLDLTGNFHSRSVADAATGRTTRIPSSTT